MKRSIYDIECRGMKMRGAASSQTWVNGGRVTSEREARSRVANLLPLWDEVRIVQYWLAGEIYRAGQLNGRRK